MTKRRDRRRQSGRKNSANRGGPGNAKQGRRSRDRRQKQFLRVLENLLQRHNRPLSPCPLRLLLQIFVHEVALHLSSPRLFRGPEVSSARANLRRSVGHEFE